MNKNSNIVDNGTTLEIESQQVRDDIYFPIRQLHTNSQRLVLMVLRYSTIPIDNITKFSVRPPESLSIFDQVGNYCHWFICSRKPMKRSELEETLKSDINDLLLLMGYSIKYESE